MRAALESVAFQMIVYLEFLQKSNNINLQKISIDGGMVKNNLFLQMIADLLQIEVKGRGYETDESGNWFFKKGPNRSKVLSPLNSLGDKESKIRKTSMLNNDNRSEVLSLA